MPFQKVNDLQAKLKALRPLDLAELKRLRNEFVIENTYHSNAIEGNSLTLRETALVLEGLTIGEKPIKDHLEAIGHKDAFDFVTELADSHSELSESIIKQIHSLVLMNDRKNAGVYRNVPVAISGAVHTPPPPYLVGEQFAQLLTDYSAMTINRPILEVIAVFHLRFEGIHPFIDGNGRTGRLILNLELMKAGFLPVNIKFKDRRKYYDCFDSFFGQAHTAAPLTALLTSYEEEALTRYINILSNH